MQYRIFLLIALATLAPTSQVFAADKVTYENNVQPILREHCFACHNQDEAKSGLSLDSFEGLTTGGASGEVVSAGDSGGSRLWKLVTHQEEPKMPPGDKLPEKQLQVLRAWIEGGLLKDAGSKPLKSSKPAIAKIDAGKLGKPLGEPAMPLQLFHEPVLWTSHVGPVDALATSPWAPLVAVAWQRQVSFYDTDTHDLLGIIPYVDGVPRVVRFSRDGSLVLVAGGRHAAVGSAALFDVETGGRLATIGDELDIVLAADISPDLSLVALGGPKKKVHIYRVADGSLAYQISKHTDWITAVGFSPNGKLLATADRNGAALLWQANAGHERADLRGHKGAITSLDWRADAAMLATASEDGTTRLWNPAGQQIKSIETHKGGVLSVRFANEGSFVTAGRDQKVRTWKSDGGAVADLGNMAGMALAAAFTHDGTKVIASDYTGEVRVIDTADKQQLATLQASPQFLGQRLTLTEKVLQAAQQKLQANEKQLTTQLAALEAGKAAHETHQNKLAKAQIALAEEQKKHDELAKAQSDHQQQVAATRQPLEQAVVSLADVRQLLEQAETPSKDEDEASEEAQPDQMAALKQRVAAAEKAHAAATQASQQAEQQLEAATEKREAAEKSVKATEAILAQVTRETTGLPDLTKLTQQHELAQTAAVAAKKLLVEAQQKRAKLAAQRTRYANAHEQFAAEVHARQAKQQELAKQSGKLEAEHEQAAQQLSTHRNQLTELTNQLTAIQAELAELQSVDTTLQKTERKFATELAKIQASLADSQQAIFRLEASKKDFAAAEELRKAYSANQKKTAGQE